MFLLVCITLYLSFTSACLQNVYNSSSNSTSSDTKIYNLTFSKEYLQETLKVVFNGDITQGPSDIIVKVTLPEGVSTLSGYNGCNGDSICKGCRMNFFMFDTFPTCNNKDHYSCSKSINDCTHSTDKLKSKKGGKPPKSQSGHSHSDHSHPPIRRELDHYDPNPEFFTGTSSRFNIYQPAAGDYYFLYQINGEKGENYPPPATFNIPLKLNFIASMKKEVTVQPMKKANTCPDHVHAHDGHQYASNTDANSWDCDDLKLGKLTTNKEIKYFSYKYGGGNRMEGFYHLKITSTNKKAKFNIFTQSSLHQNTVPTLVSNDQFAFKKTSGSKVLSMGYYQGKMIKQYVSYPMCTIPKKIHSIGKATDLALKDSSDYVKTAEGLLSELTYTAGVQCVESDSGDCGEVSLTLIFQKSCVSGSRSVCPEFMTSTVVTLIATAVSWLILKFCLNKTRAILNEVRPAQVPAYYKTARNVFYITSLQWIIFVNLPEFMSFLVWKIPSIVGVMIFSYGFERYKKSIVQLWTIVSGISICLNFFNAMTTFARAWGRYLPASIQTAAGLLTITIWISLIVSFAVGVMLVSNWPQNARNVQVVQMGTTAVATPVSNDERINSDDIQEGIPVETPL